MSNSRKANLFFFTLLFMILGGCVSAPKPVQVGQDPDIVLTPTEYSGTFRKASRLWSKREDYESLLEFTRTNDFIARSQKRSVNDMILQARAFYLLGEYFSRSEFERKDRGAMAERWATAARVIAKATPNEVIAEYWLAAALWLEQKDFERGKQLIEQVRALNPNYFYGGVYRYYGIYYSVREDSDGGDLKKSLENFELVNKLYPQFFANHVAYARFYAKKMDDASLFKSQLAIVVNANENLPKDVAPEQRLEKNRAKSLMSKGPSP
jgi:tetratricopeptide (TPR) repeat protein